MTYNVSKYTDEILIDMMKACQREYNKRFQKKKSQALYTCTKCGRITTNTSSKCVRCSDIKFRCCICDTDLTGKPRMVIGRDMARCYKGCDIVNKLQEELKQRTNNRDHYKNKYEELKEENKKLEEENKQLKNIINSLKNNLFLLKCDIEHYGL